MDGVPVDDDITYTILGLLILENAGVGFTVEDVATAWKKYLPIACTAERVAYANFSAGVHPPASAVHANPYREWIGAQIRADFFGYAHPGDPARAAAWAWRDACISHVRNGVYGEMWVAAMLAAAFVEDDWLRIIHAGLAQIPRRSRLHAEIARFLRLYQDGATYEQAVGELHRSWNERNRHHWCHTISNAVIVLLGLLYGGDDYGTTVARAVMPGFDTDCNGATCGSLWGVKHGVSALPRRWTAPVRDRLRTGVAGYHDVAISRPAADMVDAARRNRRG